jgi:CPA2 family monovalent cation:H+ antiporter-2
MAPEFAAHDYKDLLVFLATAGVVVPVFNRFKISPVLGFLTAGVLLGPDGLGRLAQTYPWLGIFTIGDAREIGLISEFGVVFLLFMIGLELSWERLRAMRRLVFGLGAAQVAVCTLLVGAAAFLLGQPPVAAAVIGVGLALSSTAVVMPVLAERRRLKSAAGRSAFAVLLAQDLAVAPVLVTITVLGSAAAGGDAPWTKALLALAPALAAVAVLVVGGRLLLRPLFHSVARANSPELFVALSLLIVIGAGVTAAISGLSMALGAFIAGLLLAETEFRREVEVTVEPFKGLLLGMFFVSVGVGLDLDGVIAQPLTLVGIALGVIALKTGAIFGLGKLFGLPGRAALEAGMVLGPAGEFAFVVLGAGVAAGLIDPGPGQLALVAATLSLFTVPALAAVGQKLSRQMKKPDESVPEALAEMDALAGQVLVVGYGRVGRLVGEMLSRHDVPFVAVDSDPTLVSRVRGDGQAIYFGDAAREEFLKRCGIETAKALVVTMDAPGKVDEVVKAARTLRPDLTIVARARDSRHAAKLYRLGVTDAVPETTEASLQLAENTLVDIGVPMGLVIASIHEKRDEYRRLFQENSPDDRPVRAMRRTRGPVDLF